MNFDDEYSEFASVDLSLEGFDGASATHGLKKPIKMICYTAS